jgi:ribosomal protein S20
MLPTEENIVYNYDQNKNKSCLSRVRTLIKSFKK